MLTNRSLVNSSSGGSSRERKAREMYLEDVMWWALVNFSGIKSVNQPDLAAIAVSQIIDASPHRSW